MYNTYARDGRRGIFIELRVFAVFMKTNFQNQEEARNSLLPEQTLICLVDEEEKEDSNDEEAGFEMAHWVVKSKNFSWNRRFNLNQYFILVELNKPTVQFYSIYKLEQILDFNVQSNGLHPAVLRINTCTTMDEWDYYELVCNFFKKQAMRILVLQKALRSKRLLNPFDTSTYDWKATSYSPTFYRVQYLRNLGYEDDETSEESVQTVSTSATQSSDGIDELFSQR